MSETNSFPLRPKQILLAAVLLCFALHLPTYYSGHSEGDEVVFRKLGENMSWTLGHYTVMDIPIVNQLPDRLYRAPLFPHPPLFPLWLKVSTYLGNGLTLALSLGLLLKIAAIFYGNALLRFLQDSEIVAAAGALFVSLCPILSFTSTRLLADTGFAVFLLVGTTHLLFAQATNRRRHWFLAAAGFALFFNCKYQAIAFLPLPFLLLAREWPARVPRRALYFLAPAMLLGAQHFLRLCVEYGSPFLGNLIKEVSPPNQFVRTISERTRWQVLVYLCVLCPAYFVFLFPDFWRTFQAALKHREAAAVPGAVAAYLFLVTLLFMPWQERYWEPFELFAVLAIFLSITRLDARARNLACLLVLLSFVSMSWTSFVDNVIYHGDQLAFVRPSLSFLTPGLKLLYFHLGDMF